jgi:PKD repeat protein
MTKLLSGLAALVAVLALAPASFGQVCADCGGDGGGGGGGGSNSTPTAAFSFAPVSPFTGVSVTFTNQSTDDGTFTSAWNFGDGSTSTDASPAHSYAASGTYTVSLTVTDTGNLSSTITHQITIVNRAPTASFTMKGVVQPGEDIGLANNSSDQDGQVTSYQWSFDDGTSSTQSAPQKSYGNPGTYHVSLQAFDNNGSYSTMLQDVRVNAQPTALIIVAPDQTAGQDVQFDSSASDSDGTVASYAWDFGDGSLGTGGTPAHAYAQAGDYTAKLTVTDNDGGKNTVQTVVHVATQQTDGGGQAGGDQGGKTTTSQSAGSTGSASSGGEQTQQQSQGSDLGAQAGGADKTAPALVVPAKLKATKKAGKLVYTVSTDEAATIVAKLEGKVAGSAIVKITKAGSGKVTIKLSSKAKKALRAAKVVKLTLVTTATDAAGNKTTKTTKVTLV